MSVPSDTNRSTHNNEQLPSAELKELERMVNTFRVNDLKELLIFAGLSYLGRKDQLLDRALSELRSTSNRMFFGKVRQLHWHLWDKNKSLVEGNYAAPPSSTSSAITKDYIPIAPNLATATSTQQTPNTNVRPSIIQQNATRLNIAQYPNVKLTHLPFYDVQDEIMKPTTLVPLSVNKFQDNHMTFTLSQSQLTQLALSDLKKLPRVELQLRFCLLDTTKLQPDDFPSGCVLRLNDRIVQLPAPIPTNKVGVEPKRPSRPVDITMYLLPRNNEQRIQVSWNNDNARFWSVSVYVVKHLTTQILFQRIESKGIRVEEESISMIKRKLGADGADNDIAATSLRVSLNCPLGKVRMRRPCRLRSCTHLQCFDLELFLQMNEKHPTWTCPVCDAPTFPFSDLQIDGYFTRMLAETKRDVQEVELYEGGKFSAIVEPEADILNGGDKPMKCDSKVTTKSEKPPILEPTSSKGNAEKPPEMSKNSTSKPSCTNDIEVIDLLSSDDDDDDDKYCGRSTSSNTRTSSKSGTSAINFSSNSTSPSVIILDSPSPPRSTPEDPRNTESRDGQQKRSYQASASECPRSPPKKQSRANAEPNSRGLSLVMPEVNSNYEMDPMLPTRRHVLMHGTSPNDIMVTMTNDSRSQNNAQNSPTSGIDPTSGVFAAATYAAVMQQLLGFSNMTNDQRNPLYGIGSFPSTSVPHQYVPNYQDFPSMLRPSYHSVSSPSDFGPVQNSATSTSNSGNYSGHLSQQYQEFETFLKSCLPPQ